jgi:hypothetical protein
MDRLPYGAPAHRLEIARRSVRARQRLCAVACLAGLFALSSCGSKTSDTPGPNSGGSAGSGSVCAVGDTRTCVGPGACDGGQVCLPGGSWATCDCGQGGQGGEPAIGTTAGTSNGGGGGAGLSAGGTTGSAAMSAGGLSGESGATGGGAAGAAGLQALNPGDDPCLDAAVTADCSGQCSSTQDACEMECPAVVQLDSIKIGQVIARTPSRPGARCTCSIGGDTTVVYRLAIKLVPVGSTEFHLTVPLPWHVGSDPSCLSEPDTKDACESSYGTWNVWTTDPNAPAINLVAQFGVCL